MAYSTSADLLQAVGGSARHRQLTDWDGDGQPDATVIANAIAEADALIDGYAVKRYAVPFNPPSEMITKMSARLARFNLRQARGTLSEGDVLQFDKDLKWLDMLSKGEVTPGTDPPPTKSSMVVDKATARPSGKDVSRDKLKGFA